MLEAFWGTFAQVAATMVSIFAGFFVAWIIYLKQKSDELDSRIRERKYEIADMLASCVADYSEGGVPFFAGNYDREALNRVTLEISRMVVGPEPLEEEIPEIAKQLMDKLRNLAQLMPQKTWELLSSRFTGIDSRIAELPEEEYEQWSEQMYDYATQLESIWKFGNERLTKTIRIWESSWEGARVFLSKEGIERFFKTFSRVKEALFEIDRLKSMRNAYALSVTFPLWSLTFLGLILSFVSAVLVPLISLLYDLDGYVAIVTLSVFVISMTIAAMPLLGRAMKGRTLSWKLVVGYARHIRNILRLKWISSFGPEPETSSQRKLLVECKNPECRKEFFCGITVASSNKIYRSRNIDRNKYQCKYCGKSAIYNWQDYRFE